VRGGGFLSFSGRSAVCGLRFGELAGLTRADVNLELAVIMVRADLDELDGGGLQPGEVKSYTSRHTVSILAALIDEVRCHLDLRGRG
jgi:integrase